MLSEEGTVAAMRKDKQIGETDSAIREKRFQKLQDQYESVYRFLRAAVNDHYQAEDLVQEVYQKVWTGLPALKDDRELIGWLYTIARNTLKDFYRKRYRERKRMYLSKDPVTEAESFFNKRTNPGNNPDRRDEMINRMIREESARDLEQAFSCLNDEHAGLMKMWIFGSFNEKEIAEITGMNYNTVRSIISRSRKKMQAHYLNIKGGGQDEA